MRTKQFRDIPKSIGYPKRFNVIIVSTQHIGIAVTNHNAVNVFGISLFQCVFQYSGLGHPGTFIISRAKTAIEILTDFQFVGNVMNQFFRLGRGNVDIVA